MIRLNLRNFSKYRCVYLNAVKLQQISSKCNVACHTHVARLHDISMKSIPIQQQIQKYSIKSQNDESKITENLRKLESQYKTLGYLSYEHVKKTVNLLEQQRELSNQMITADESLFLLRASGIFLPMETPQNRWNLFEKIWNYLCCNKLLHMPHFVARLQIMRHNKIQLENVNKFLKEHSQHLTAEFFDNLLLLTCCNKNLTQTIDVVKEMQARGFNLTIPHSNAILRAYGKNVLQEKFQIKLNDNIDTQFSLILFNLEANDKTATAILLQEHSGQFNVQQLVEILRVATENSEENVNLYQQILNEFPKNYLQQLELPIEMRVLCIQLIAQRQFETLKTLLTLLPNPKFNEDQSEDGYCMFLLREMVRENVNMDIILDFCELLQTSGKNSRSLHIATEYALRYNVEKAAQLFESLAKKEQLKVHYFWPLLLQNFRKQGDQGLLDTLRLMQHYQVACDHATLTQYVLPRLSVLQKNARETIKLLENYGLKPSLCVPPIIANLLTQGQMKEIIDLLQQYPQPLVLQHFVPQIATLSVNVRVVRQYHLYAKLLATLWQHTNTQDMDFVGDICQKMFNTHVRLRSDSQALLNFLQAMEKFNLKLSINAANNIRTELQQQTMYSKPTDFQEINQLLQKMTNKKPLRKDHNLQNNSNFVENVSSNTSMPVTPKQMTLAELEAQISDLQGKGQNVRGLLRRYLQLCVRDGLLERALEVKLQCDKLKVNETPGMCACIFDMYIKLKDMQNAEKTLQHMKSAYPGFQLDEHKFVDYTALLVQNDRLEEAKELLKERAKSQKVVGRDYVIKNVWQLLKNVAENAAKKSEPNITKYMFELLQELKYCQVQNVLLGPIVREHLLRQNIRLAVKEFLQLAQQYKCTPLQRELLSILVGLSNANTEDCKLFAIDAEEAQTLLDAVCKCISEVHGSVNMHSGMLVAFAETGTEKQLRRLLLNPEFSLNQEHIIKDCEFLSKNGNLNSLLRLAKAVRGLRHIIDEQSIYNMILEKHIAENNCEAALQLYEHLELDDEFKMPDKFTQDLVKLLQANSFDIPSSILLKAQVRS